MTAKRRRPPGEGGVFEYQTKAGMIRFGIKFDLPSLDGRRHQVLRKLDPDGRPWLAYEDAAGALREAIVKAARGEAWDKPSAPRRPAIGVGGDDDPACWTWPVPQTLGFADERSAEEFLRHWNQQCAICGWRDAEVTDHDYQTGLVRGRLCRSCNVREGVSAEGVFVKYRERNPATMLGIQVRYWSPFGLSSAQEWETV
jgi:hypothetical protein